MLSVDSSPNRNSPSINELEMETHRFKALKVTVQKDSLDKQGSEIEADTKKVRETSQTLAGIWQWLASLFGKEATVAVAEANHENTVEPLSPTSPLLRPQEISAKEAARLMEELKGLLKELNHQTDFKLSGSLEQALQKRYKTQSASYEEAVIQGREKFVMTQTQKKLWENRYMDARKEYDKIGDDTRWWQTANTYALYAVTAVTAVVAAYAFGSAPRWQDGISQACQAAITVGGAFYAAATGITTIAKTNLEYRATIKQGDMTILRHKNWMIDVSLRKTIDFLADQFSRHNQKFVEMKDMGDLMYQTVRSFNS